jgi:hypothetical protein
MRWSPDNPQSPINYTVVRAGRGWPELRQQADTQSRSDHGRETDSDTRTRGAGEGLPPSRRVSSINASARDFSPHGVPSAGVPARRDSSHGQRTGGMTDLSLALFSPAVSLAFADSLLDRLLVRPPGKWQCLYKPARYERRAVRPLYERPADAIRVPPGKSASRRPERG